MHKCMRFGIVFADRDGFVKNTSCLFYGYLKKSCMIEKILHKWNTYLANTLFGGK